MSSSTTLTVIAPAGSAGSVNVTVTVSGQTSATSAKDLFAYGGPSVTSFKPSSGITGSSVTLTGSAFAAGVTVKFGSLAAVATVVSGTSLKVTVPSGDPGPSTITVSDAEGSSTSSSEFTPTMSITGFTPSSGAAGTQVTISGFGFTSSSTVKFNTTTATIDSQSATQIVATVPSGATTGSISVTNPKGSTPVGTVKSASKYTV